MSTKYYFGQLNSATIPQRGKYLNNVRPTALESLKSTVSENSKPNLLKKIYGPLKGVVLRDETDQVSNLNSQLNWNGISDGTAKKLQKVRVRIPEFHAHLPDPEVYGESGPNEIISLYPVFVAQTVDIEPASPYDVVWVDYLDRDNLEDPVYLGRVDAVKTVPNQTSVLNRATNAFKNAVNNIFNPNPDPNALDSATCGLSRNVTNLPPKCPENEIAGEYSVYASNQNNLNDFVEIGKIRVNQWLNRNGTTKLIRADIENTLKLMQEAFIKETGIKKEEIAQFINDGYRTAEKQTCYYNKYTKCLEEWRNNGSNPNTKPFPVAKPGFSKHSSGNATDFNRVQINNRGSLLWNWLQKNSQRFGWVWRSDINPQEAWHYEFNESLARRNGLIT